MPTASTNVRTPWWLAPLRLAARLAPQRAARLGIAWFTRTRRRREHASVAMLRAEGQTFAVALDGVALRGHVWGRGPTVLLQHGWDGSVASFSELIPALVSAGYRVVMTEGPGHGQSDGTQATLVHLSRALSLTGALHGPVHAVIAHSLGAPATTLALCEGTLDAARVVLVAPAVDPAFWIRRLAGALGDRMVDAVEREIARVADRPLDAVGVANHLASRDLPVTVFHDGGDREVPVGPVRALAEKHAGVALHLTQGLGHNRILRDPGVIRRIVAALRSAPAQSQPTESTALPAYFL